MKEGQRNESSVRIAKTDSRYPARLKDYPGMPANLHVIGTLPDPQGPSVAIVGARMCSAYGRRQAFRYARTLSEAGVQIISGMAAGIDAAGHEGALAGGTPTYAVLGCGADVCYPAENRALYQRILAASGGMISEYPDQTAPRAYHFPARNRIISALADVVLVVEARERSGSLITAGYALEQGRAVYAVPGCVEDTLSIGCHRLIYDGAGIAYSPEILLEELGITGKAGSAAKEKSKVSLATDLNLVYSCLDLRPKSFEYIVGRTGFSPGKVSGILMELQLMGLVKEECRQYYVRASL